VSWRHPAIAVIAELKKGKNISLSNAFGQQKIAGYIHKLSHRGVILKRFISLKNHLQAQNALLNVKWSAVLHDVYAAESRVGSLRILAAPLYLREYFVVGWPY
jgi:hypothetical protein